MTKRVLSKPGDEHYRVRVVLHAALLHLASATEPKVIRAPFAHPEVEADWLDDPDKGDTLGFIDWSSVKAVTWRWTGSDDPDKEDR